MKKYNLPKGLIVNLALPEKKEPEAADFTRLFPMLNTRVDGILIDPLFWKTKGDLARYQRLFIERCVEAIPSHVPVFVMITGSDESETGDILEAVLGAAGQIKETRDIFLVDLPLWYHSNRGLPDYYRSLLSKSDLPVLLMNDPERIQTSKPFYRRRNLVPGVLKKIAEIPGVCGLINASDIKHGLSYSRIMRDKLDFRIYDGSESLFLENPNKNGLLSVTANLFPSAWKSIAESSTRLEDFPGMPDMIKERWLLGRFLQQVAKEIDRDAPFFIRYVLNYWGVFEDPPGSPSGYDSETRAQRFVKFHPEPDKIQPY